MEHKHIIRNTFHDLQVGLMSPVIHHQFQLIPGVYLDLIRRCSAHTCLGHCVCSPRNSYCALNGNSCQDVSIGKSKIVLKGCRLLFFIIKKSDISICHINLQKISWIL